MKAKPKPRPRVIATIRRNSIMFRILSKIPMAVSPFRLTYARVGNNFTDHIDIVWRF